MTLPFNLRVAATLTGSTLMASGALVAAGTVVTQLAWALPVADALARPGATIALAFVTTGATVLRLAGAIDRHRRTVAPARALRVRRAV